MESRCFAAHLCCVVPLQQLVYMPKTSVWKADKTRVCVNLLWLTFLKEHHSFPQKENNLSNHPHSIMVWLSFPSLIWCWSLIRMQPYNKRRMGSAAHIGWGGICEGFERPCLHLCVGKHLRQRWLNKLLLIPYHLLNWTDSPGYVAVC